MHEEIGYDGPRTEEEWKILRAIVELVAKGTGQAVFDAELQSWLAARSLYGTPENPKPHN